MNRKYFYIALLILLGFYSCEEKKELNLIKVTEYSASKVSDSSLLKMLKIKNNLTIKIDYTLSEDYALTQLSNKKTDLVIIPNNATSEDMSIKAIAPLLPRILMVITNKKVEEKSLKEIIENGEIYFEERSRLDSIFFDKLFYNFNIDESKISSKNGIEELNLNEETDSLKVYIGLTHVNNVLVKKLIHQNWFFFSLDDVNDFGKGSKVEGFTLMNMSVRPYIIPKSIYRGKPDNSILTIAIYDILITRDDISNELIYDLTKTLYENRSRLIQMNPVYNLLKLGYDAQDLSFPLHKGTIQFIDRNEPPVWFKYVKIVWPLISISVVIFGIIASLRQRLRKRKKQNIEMYYSNLIDIKGKAEDADTIEKHRKLLKEIRILRSKAMTSLADKKLEPGESFNIFLALYNEIKTDLGEEIRTINNNEKKT